MAASDWNWHEQAQSVTLTSLSLATQDYAWILKPVNQANLGQWRRGGHGEPGGSR